MEASVFLARALSIYLIIISIAMLLNTVYFKAVINDVSKNPSQSFLLGILALTFGILMVVTNNIWAINWRVLITLLAWLALLKGSMLLVFPNATEHLISQYTKNHTAYYASAIVCLFLGLLLFFCGFLIN